MPRRIIKRLLPDPRKFREHPHLRRFGARLHDNNLWHLNRRSVSGGVGIGLFCALLPLPFQMLIAATLAIWLRTNLTISVALVWTTNPLTMPPVFYATYTLGGWILGQPPAIRDFQFNWDNLLAGMGGMWKPLLLGSTVAGTVIALTGFILVRIGWRLYVLQQRRDRRHRVALSAKPLQ